MLRLNGPVAHRYELDVPLRYRRAGDPGWRDGRTVNASRTGVLFQTAGEEFDRGTAIELQLELPGAARVATVHCTGSVVRCERSAPDHLRIAATIDVYRFGVEHGAAVPSLPSA
jgi:hypothetical protein